MITITIPDDVDLLDKLTQCVRDEYIRTCHNLIQARQLATIAMGEGQGEANERVVMFADHAEGLRILLEYLQKTHEEVHGKS
jgi:hypothetical protein